MKYNTPEEYIDCVKVETIDGINITDRPDDISVELKELREITIETQESTLALTLSNHHLGVNEHFRMNYECKVKQVLKLNNITDLTISKRETP